MKRIVILCLFFLTVKAAPDWLRDIKEPRVAQLALSLVENNRVELEQTALTYAQKPGRYIALSEAAIAVAARKPEALSTAFDVISKLFPEAFECNVPCYLWKQRSKANTPQYLRELLANKEKLSSFLRLYFFGRMSRGSTNRIKKAVGELDHYDVKLCKELYRISNGTLGHDELWQLIDNVAHAFPADTSKTRLDVFCSCMPENPLFVEQYLDVAHQMLPAFIEQPNFCFLDIDSSSLARVLRRFPITQIADRVVAINIAEHPELPGYRAEISSLYNGFLRAFEYVMHTPTSAGVQPFEQWFFSNCASLLTIPEERFHHAIARFDECSSLLVYRLRSMGQIELLLRQTIAAHDRIKAMPEYAISSRKNQIQSLFWDRLNTILTSSILDRAVSEAQLQGLVASLPLEQMTDILPAYKSALSICTAFEYLVSHQAFSQSVEARDRVLGAIADRVVQFAILDLDDRLINPHEYDLIFNKISRIYSLLDQMPELDRTSEFYQQAQNGLYLLAAVFLEKKITTTQVPLLTQTSLEEILRPIELFLSIGQQRRLFDSNVPVFNMLVARVFNKAALLIAEAEPAQLWEQTTLLASCSSFFALHLHLVLNADLSLIDQQADFYIQSNRIKDRLGASYALLAQKLASKPYLERFDVLSYMAWSLIQLMPCNEEYIKRFAEALKKAQLEAGIGRYIAPLSFYIYPCFSQHILTNLPLPQELDRRRIADYIETVMPLVSYDMAFEELLRNIRTDQLSESYGQRSIQNLKPDKAAAVLNLPYEGGFLLPVFLHNIRSQLLFPLLVHAGFNINARGKHEQTALMQCAMRGNIAMFDALMHHGADGLLVDDASRTVVDYIFISSRLSHDQRKDLLNRVLVYQPQLAAIVATTEGLSPVMNYIKIHQELNLSHTEEQMIEYIDILINRGVSIQAQTIYGLTAVDMAYAAHLNQLGHYLAERLYAQDASDTNRYITYAQALEIFNQECASLTDLQVVERMRDQLTALYRFEHTRVRTNTVIDEIRQNLTTATQVVNDPYAQQRVIDADGNGSFISFSSYRQLVLTNTLHRAFKQAIRPDAFVEIPSLAAYLLMLGQQRNSLNNGLLSFDHYPSLDPVTQEGLQITLTEFNALLAVTEPGTIRDIVQDAFTSADNLAAAMRTARIHSNEIAEALELYISHGRVDLSCVRLLVESSL